MKDKILGWLFKSHVKRLKESSETALELQMEAFERTLDVKDLIRERLKGIRPNHPEENTILQNHISTLDDASRLVFLSKAHEVMENPTAKLVMESLMIESEHKAMIEAVDIVDVNFNRASINGLMLYEEEMERLDTMYKTEKEQQKEMTDAERLSAL